MSYTIDMFQINAAEYALEDNTAVYLYTDNYGVVIKDNNWTYWNDLLAAHPSLIYIRPYREHMYLVWDDVNKEWVIDQVLFTEALKEELKVHRESKATAQVSYNGVTAENTVEVRNLIISIIVYLQAKGDQTTLNWKQPDNSFVTATVSDFQGIMLDGGQMTQDAFTSEAYILALHEVTPFTSLQDAKDAFDIHFNTLQGV